MAIYLLPKDPVFPPISEAEENGLIAIGGDFSPDRLLQAYTHGIFPWFEEEGEIFWFSPDPRLVLFPERLRISPSLIRILRSGRFMVRFDTDFTGVIEACAQVPRPNQENSWISNRFIQGYTRLHELGFAHSVECYQDGKLAGGLYGVSLGVVFFGESMFHHIKDASKVAFIKLVEQIREWGFRFIDCQVESPHLRQFGAEMISRERYLAILETAVKESTRKGSWC